MAKLDVGVGDEFPTEEIKRDPDGTIHHHHYYYRRPRRPFGVLRFVLGVILIGMIFHLVRLADWDWDLPFLPHGYLRFVTTLIGIAAVLGLLFYMRRCDFEDRR
jgi:hypothetical protein